MKSLIISSPFERPTHHWKRASDSRLELVEGRRPAGYEIFDTRNNTVRGVELEVSVHPPYKGKGVAAEV